MAKKKRVTWQSKLTKKELKHLKEDAGVTDKASLERNFAGQAEMRREHPEFSDPCWECRAIAEKLGFPV